MAKHGHFNADTMTSGPAKAIHAGVNSRVATFDLNSTASASLTVALMSLPAGARVQFVNVTADNQQGGTAAEGLTVYAKIGGSSVATYIATAAHATTIVSNATGIGTRLTASAILQMQFAGVVGTGTASGVYKVTCMYLAEDDGD